MENLISKRLLLKPLTVEDAKEIYELNKDPDVIKFTGDNSFANISEAEKFLISYNHYEKWERGRYAVFLKENNTFLGWCGLKYHEESGETDLGYRFRKEFWGKGIGTEAATIALKDGFERLHLKRIYAEANSENKGSIRIMKKIGMKFYKETLLAGEPGVIYEIFNPNN